MFDVKRRFRREPARLSVLWAIPCWLTTEGAPEKAGRAMATCPSRHASCKLEMPINLLHHPFFGGETMTRAAPKILGAAQFCLSISATSAPRAV